MKNKISFIVAPVVFFCWCAFFLQGCKKEPLINDNSLLTVDDSLTIAKDTLHLKVLSSFETSLNSSGVSEGVLGTLVDPDFGNTYAGFYAQYAITGNNINFGPNPLLDSAVLTLRYSTTYGKFTQAQTVNVYALNESMVTGINYTTKSVFGVDNTPVGTRTGFIPNLTGDTLTALNGIFPSHLRIRVDALGTDILTSVNSDTSIVRDNASFQARFKGFYVSTSGSTTGDGLTKFDLVSEFTGVTLFFHNDTSSGRFYNFPVSGIRVNHFDNYYTGSLTALVNAQNVNGDEKMYIQAGGGIKGKIFITDLDDLPKNIAINKAELILSQTESNSGIAPAQILDLYRIDDAGQAIQIEDYSPLSTWGEGNSETVNGVTYYRYRFNFKNYFQKLLQGIYHNNGFYIEAYNPGSGSERVVIANSSTDKKYQIALYVTYTKL